MKTVRCILTAGCGLITLAAMGCGPGPKDLQIQAQQEEINRLQQDKAALSSQLAQALADRDQCRGQLFDLQRQLSDLQAKLAASEATAEQRGDWRELPGIAWQDVAVDILFDSGKAKLKSSAKAKLQQIVADIQQRFPDRQIWVVGHTDSDPIKHSGWKDNLELSVQRACTVFRELQKMGLDPKRMVAAGQGEYNPKAPNTPKEKHKNRRVQVIAVQIPDTTTFSGERG